MKTINRSVHVTLVLHLHSSLCNVYCTLLWGKTNFTVQGSFPRNQDVNRRLIYYKSCRIVASEAEFATKPSDTIVFGRIPDVLFMWATQVFTHRPRRTLGAQSSWTNVSMWVKVSQVMGSYSPSLWTFLRVTEGVEMAEARKLAGRVSAESEVTPRRSFSLNIFLQEGERVNVLVPSWQMGTECEHKDGCSGKPSLQSVRFVVFQSDQHAYLVRSSLRSHGDEGVVLLL